MRSERMRHGGGPGRRRGSSQYAGAGADCSGPTVGRDAAVSAGAGAVGAVGGGGLMDLGWMDEAGHEQKRNLQSSLRVRYKGERHSWERTPSEGGGLQDDYRAAIQAS
jgi:hypothetical protein